MTFIIKIIVLVTDDSDYIDNDDDGDVEKIFEEEEKDETMMIWSLKIALIRRILAIMKIRTIVMMIIMMMRNFLTF